MSGKRGETTAVPKGRKKEKGPGTYHGRPMRDFVLCRSLSRSWDERETRQKTKRGTGGGDRIHTWPQIVVRSKTKDFWDRTRREGLDQKADSAVATDWLDNGGKLSLVKRKGPIRG